MVGKSLRLINTFFSAVFAAFLLEPLTSGLPVDAVVAMALGAAGALGKVVLFSGAFGVLVDMAGGREDFCTRRDFLANVRSLGVLYAALSAVVVLLYLLYLQVAPRWPVPLPVFQAACDVWVLYWFARKAVQMKYRPGELSLTAGKDMSGLAGAVVLWLAYLGLAAAAFQEPAPADPRWLILLLGIKYLQFLIYGAFVHRELGGYASGPARTGGRELILVQPELNNPFLNFLLLFQSGYYPAAFAVLRSLTPPSYRVREFYRRIWRESYYKKDVLVAVTCMTTTSLEAYRIARGFKKAGAKVVMGGPHVSFVPEEALEFCDSVVIGPAEGVWEEVLRDYENNSLKPVYQGHCPQEKFDLPLRFLLTCPPEQGANFIESARGCKFSCDFCIMSAWGAGLQHHDLQAFCDLVRHAGSGSRRINFIDYNLYADPGHMEKVLRAVEPLGVRWYASISIDVAQNDRLLELMKASGCAGVLIGYEISGDSPVSGCGGKFALAGKYLELTRKLKKKGFMVKAHFIVGFDEDTWVGLLRLWGFAFRLFPNIIGYSTLLPFPGTRYFRKVVEENRVRDLNWSRYGMFNMVCEHPRMSSSILENIMPFYFFLLCMCSRNVVLLLAGIILSVGMAYVCIKLKFGPFFY